MRCLAILIVVCVTLPGMGSTSHGQTDSIENGHVFAGGTYIRGPYNLSMDRDTITVNGIKLLTQSQSIESNGYGSLAIQQTPLRRDGKFAGPPGRRFEGQRGRANGSGGQGRGNGPPENLKSPERQVREFENLLRYGGILVASREKNQVVEVSLEQSKLDFARVLLEGGKFEERSLQQLQPIWDAEFSEFSLTADLRESLTQIGEEYDAVAERNLRQNQALQRLNRAGYPLTVIGMLLGALALGHNLQWSANAVTGKKANQFVVKGVGLILAMSALDLTWTILSSQAGQMREVNPFASDLVHSPVQLIIFKVIATATSCGILFALKSNPKVQQAAWWMCLVCVLLTFRWVMLNSLMT